jgi:hypothetical protein
VLSPRNEKDYRQVVERWTRDGQPDPMAWVSERVVRSDQAERSCWAHLALQGEPREVLCASPDAELVLLSPVCQRIPAPLRPVCTSSR